MKAIDIANALIMNYADADYLTNMKLNKLVYFTYAKALQNGCTLFDDSIEAWAYGPVIPNVYKEFAHLGSGQITLPTSKEVPVEAASAAQDIWGVYGFLTAMDIVEFSHRDGSAWKATYTKGVYHIPINNSDIIASTDGIEKPRREGTFAEAMDEASKRWSHVLDMLADS